MNVEKELATLQQLGTNALQELYLQVYGEPTNGRHKGWLVKRIIWRIQAREEGGLSERAKRRAAELARDAQIRTTAPKPQKPVVATATLPVGNIRDERLPTPGTLITRPYKGATLQVKVLQDGFEYLGERYHSLSAVAKAITGTHTNGYLFFRLKGGGR